MPTPTTPPPHEYDAEADHDADRDADQDFRGSVVAGLPICEAMLGIGRSLHRQMHTFARNGPSETLRRKVAELEKLRRKRNLKRTELFVEVPESRSYLDTATMPMIAVAVGGALFAKLLMMYDDSKSQEMIERKIQHAPVGQGTVRMLSREEWEGIKEQRPRTPFESKLARPNARIRTGEPLHMEDLKDWTSDVFADALTRAEETAKHRSN